MLTVLGLIVLLAYAVLAVMVLPGWIVSLSATQADVNHRLDAIVNTRGALLGVLAPVVIAIGSVAAFLNFRETSAQNRRTVELSRDALDVTRRAQLTERFTKAIDQLGQTAEDKLDVRIGGIYALEQIARDSSELHWPIMEVLTAYVREHARSAPPASNQAAMRSNVRGPHDRIPADIQAIAAVIGRRRLELDPPNLHLDLQDVNLRGVRLNNARLERADLRGAVLEGADLTGAQLQGARFHQAGGGVGRSC